MGRGGRTESKSNSNSRVHVKKMESEDSDEDYEAEIDDQSEDSDSLIGDDLDEELEDEDWRTVIKPQTRKVSRSPTKKRSTRNPDKCSRVPSDDDDHDDNDDNDDNDDDDQEFTPDDEFTEEEEDNLEEEEEEEEEEFPFRKNTRKRGRTDINEKTSLRRKRTRFVEDKDLLEVGPSLRDRNREKPAHRKKRVMGWSDISEEDREQVREDNQICGTKLESLRENQEDDLKINVGKGKEKAEEEKKKDVGKAVCGICLTEEGKNSVRGTLDCCDHYFCFSCIFEWSKVETRCPLCKQRFISVSKTARCLLGIDARDTVIVVPERNQVYQPTEEELQDFLNPYENVICIECHQGGDDALMLLCDLCDSPSHTYCVGLGHEVPEGNWYCDGCKPSTLGSSHSETQNLNLDQRTNPGMSNRTSMSEIDLNVTIPETLTSQGNGVFQFSSGSIRANSPPGMGVATVSGRRLIHEQIRRHILSNRASQISSDIVGPSHYVERLGENPSQSVQNRGFFLNRVGHMMGGGLGQPSTSVNGLTQNRGEWSELSRSNLGFSRSPVMVSAQTQLQPCVNRSSVGPGIGAPFFDSRFYGEQACPLKQQVQTMVRNQVKSLSLNMNLSHNDYVEILRRSTYTIMAAMGLEPPRLDTYAVHLPTCPHLGNWFANMVTSPTYNCCVICFEDFVKGVVNKMMGIIVQPHLFNFRRQ